jgi:glycosyltransferase involved in cell wall biosynthesis
MNILMLLDNEFAPDVRVQSEALTLSKNGHSVHILCYNFGSKKNVEHFENISIIRFYLNPFIAKKLLGVLLQFPLLKLIWLWKIRQIMKTTSFNAIHIHDLPLCILSKSLKKRYKIKITADLHENYPFLVEQQPFMNTLFGKLFLSKKRWFEAEKKWLKHTDTIICVAHEMKQRIETLQGLKSEIIVVPNTINLDEFTVNQINVPDIKLRFLESFNILYIGGIDPIRGIDTLINATKLLSFKIPKLKTIIVGNGNLKSQLEEMSKQLGLNNIVIFEGQKPSTILKNYIELAHVCVIPHIKSQQTDNSSPNKLFQYMIYKRPVITSNCTSVQKIVETENCGLVFNSGDEIDMANRILELYINKELIQLYGQNGFEAVMQSYNWERTSIPLIENYR